MALVMLCGCGGAAAGGTSPAAPNGSASAPPAPPAPARAAASVSAHAGASSVQSAPASASARVLDGTCTYEHREGADYAAEAVERHVIVVITRGHVSEAHDIMSSGAGGVDTSSFAGDGPPVAPGQAVEVLVKLENGNGSHPLRFTIEGGSLKLDDGTTGRCEWSATAKAAPAPIVETPEPDHVVVRVGGTVVDCTTHLTMRAGMSECLLTGSGGSATIGHGNSDNSDELVCSRTSVEYQFEHGGGWNISDNLMTKVGAEGAVARLADGVQAWFSPELAHVEIDAPGGSVVLDIDVSGMRIAPRPGAHVANAAAKTIVDLTTPHPQAPGCDAR